MEIHGYMYMQYIAGQKGKSTVKKLNKPTKLDLVMRKIYLN